MKKAYDNRLVAGRGRHLYDKILVAALRRQCPYCEYGMVSTLDHFLPKSAFGALALEPWNLVPACKDCNHSLGAGSADDASTELIHPFVWADQETWLAASIMDGDEAVAEYRVEKPLAWSDETFSRVQSHFSRLKLKTRYAEISAGAIHEITHSLQHLRAVGQPEVIGVHLAELADAQRLARGPNHWRTALLAALAVDEWYWRSWIWN
ncbi:MAG: HNH endonuclease signature motif containing protein [Micropruina sp.]|uniref:HNH endonuclease n=1 Tax=Micropruina sp. TaxID=2737536 RepID=UPI0039E46E26